MTYPIASLEKFLETCKETESPEHIVALYVLPNEKIGIKVFTNEQLKNKPKEFKLLAIGDSEKFLIGELKLKTTDNVRHGEETEQLIQELFDIRKKKAKK